MIRLLIVLPCLLTAACVSTAPDRRAGLLTLASPPADLVLPCGLAQLLPSGGLTQAQVERAWARDRVALKVCRDRHGALVAFYEGRDRALRGKS